MRPDWTVKTLGEICIFEKAQAVHTGLAYVGLEHVESDTGRFLGQLDPVSVKSSTFRFSPEHVLYGRLRPYLNKVLLPTFEGHCSTEIFPIKPGSSVSREFLFYWLTSESTVKAIDATSTGARMPRANMNAVLDFKIGIPSFPEQQRIVAILDEAFDGIATAKANAEKNLQNARALFASHLHLVFAEPRDEWSVTTLGKICEFENGDRGKNYPNRSEYVGAGVPWINTGHIEPDGTLSDTEMNFITKKKFDSLRSGKIRAGDLVYCLRGATLGKTALVDPLTVGAVASSLVIIRPGRLLHNRFLFRFLTSPVAQAAIKLYENGAAQPNLGAKSVAKYVMNLPSLAEQKFIAGKLDELAEETQRLESIYQQKLAALDELKKSLLHQAFNGAL